MARTGKFATPAPGAYNARNCVGAEGPSLTMSPLYHDKFKERNDKLVPGPGQYDFEKQAMRTAPQFRFGTSQRAEPTVGDRKMTTEIKYDPSTQFIKSSSPN